MSPPGRPKGESLSAQREGLQLSPPGRPKGESLSAQREGCPVTSPGRPSGESARAHCHVEALMRLRRARRVVR